MRYHPPLVFKYIVAMSAFGTMTYFITSCTQQYFCKYFSFRNNENIFSYLAYPTQTRVQIRLDRFQSFPAITICSGNPLRLDKYLTPLITYILTHNLSSSPTNITRDDVYNGAFNFINITNIRELLYIQSTNN
jgi:hypothetical protein